MVAITHRVEQAAAGAAQGVQRRSDLLLFALAVHAPAAQAPAALHQLKVVQRRQAAPALIERLDHRAAGVVHQQHDMRRLQRRACADAHARRDALQNRALRRAHERGAAALEVVHLQVDADHQAQPAARGDRALHEHKAVAHGRHERAIGHIGAHRALDVRHAVEALGQVDFRERQAQRRGRVADVGFHALPVSGVGRVLITGDDRPARRIDVRRGQEDVRGRQAQGIESCGHKKRSFPSMRLSDMIASPGGACQLRTRRSESAAAPPRAPAARRAARRMRLPAARASAPAAPEIP